MRLFLSEQVTKKLSSCCFKPVTDVASKCCFPCDLLTIEYHKQVLEASITLATFVIPCIHTGISVMVYLRWFTCDN